MTDGEHVTSRLEAWLDGELGASEAAAVEGHVKGCGSCDEQAGRLRALRAAIRAELPRLPAPDVLRARIRDSLRDAAPRSGRSLRMPWRVAGLAAAAVVLVAVGWTAALRRQAGFDVTSQVLASHVRALMPGHLTDVESTDQHTVKPWFDGRLPYSPPVTDEAAAGFPLLGGRLDVVDGRPVASLVYGRRLHRISVYVWPVGYGDAGPALAERDGYNLVHWTRAGMTCWAVSDLNRDELDAFVRLLQGAGTALQPGPEGER